MNRHLLSAADLDRDDATLVLDTAAEMAQLTEGRSVKKLPTLRGRAVVNLFFEDSTRTRTSFELAAKRLSADVVNFSAKGSSLSKGESLKDTALTLEAMGADGVVVRHWASGAPHRLAHSGWIRSSVVNAGDGTHEHPTQALLDAYTLRRHLGSLGARRITIVGDVLHSRVARSNVLLLATLGADVTLVGPPTLLPVGVENWPCQTSFELGCCVRGCHDLASAASGGPPSVPRPWAGLTFPILGIISCLWLMLNLPVITWVRFLVWLDIGILIYWFYGRVHSPLADAAERSRRSLVESIGNFVVVAGALTLFNGFFITLIAYLTEFGVTSEVTAKWNEIGVTPEDADSLGLRVLGIGLICVRHRSGRAAAGRTRTP